MMLKFCLVVLLLVSFPLAARAQAPEPSEGIICTTHRTFWQGTAADIQNIRLHPAPESSRGIIEKDGCRNSRPNDLIIWHGKYGSEETMKAALEYLEGAVKLWGVGIISRGKDAKPTSKHRTEDYTYLAQYYLLGAKAFPSLDFIKSAERYQKKVKALCNKLLPDWSEPSWGSGCRMKQGVPIIDILSREIAVTRASITGQPSDIEAAKSLLARANIPSMDKIIEKASIGIEGIEDVYKLRDVRELLHLQTILATVEGRSSDEPYPDKSYELYGSLYPFLIAVELNELDSNGIPPALGQHGQLRMAFSDMHFYRAERLVENKKDDDNTNDQHIAENVSLSLNHLLAAEKDTPRYASPSQWRQIAVKFVERMELWTQLDPWHRAKLASEADRKHQLEYFKDGLNQ